MFKLCGMFNDQSISKIYFTVIHRQNNEGNKLENTGGVSGEVTLLKLPSGKTFRLEK
jgi:hypothetical protein